MGHNTKTAKSLSVYADDVAEAYERLRGRNLQIDMTRGKPSPEQLDLADGLLMVLAPGECQGEDGTDYRNYGILDGVPEAKRFFAAYMEVSPEEVIIGGNGSLQMMYDALVGGVLFGMPGGDGPWKDRAPVKFLCPVPGYDRHFYICERLGIEMVNVELGDDGPDMDAVEAAVRDDPAVKGIWCVPKYSNPTGIVYSDRTVERLAAMKTAAGDFRVMWDNAYAVHHLGDGPATVKNLLRASKTAGNPNRVLMFGSTSKMSFPGAGVGMMAASTTNIKDALGKLSAATIGPDKINQLRQVRFFRDMAGLLAHMDKQAAIIRPKFDAVDEALERNLAGKGIATWTKPKGGYFVSVDVLDGCATEIVRLAGQVGVKLVPAGATFPYRRDPQDRNIRLAPTMPSLADVCRAMEAFCTCVVLAAVNKLRRDA
jgi:DNA-binding transcriptional MocR family regulator